MVLKVDLQIGTGRRRRVFSNTHKAILHRAAEILEITVNSDPFLKAVRDYTWTDGNGQVMRKFAHSDDDGAAVLEKLFSGIDQYTDLDPDDDNAPGDGDMDIWVFPYRTKKSVIGYTNRGSYQSFINLRYLNMILDAWRDEEKVALKMAENQLHEYLHNLGYGHQDNDPNKFNNRHSVPYAVGYLVREIFPQLQPASDLQPIAANPPAVDDWHWDEPVMA